MVEMESLYKNAQDLIKNSYNLLNIRTNLGLNYMYHMDDNAVEAPPTRNGMNLRLVKSAPFDVDTAERNALLAGNHWDDIKEIFPHLREICEIRRKSGRIFARPFNEDKLWENSLNIGQIEFSIEADRSNTKVSRFTVEFQPFSVSLDDYVPIMNYITSKSKEQVDVVKYYHEHIAKACFSEEFDLADREACCALVLKFNDYLSSMGTESMPEARFDTEALSHFSDVDQCQDIMPR